MISYKVCTTKFSAKICIEIFLSYELFTECLIIATLTLLAFLFIYVSNVRWSRYTYFLNRKFLHSCQQPSATVTCVVDHKTREHDKYYFNLNDNNTSENRDFLSSLNCDKRFGRLKLRRNRR